MIVLALLFLFACSSVHAVVDSKHPDHATEPSSRHVEVRGVRLQYLDWGGTGEGLLFVPGGCDTAYVFGDIAPAFTGRFHVVSFTPRGCGSSDHPESSYELDSLIEEMAGFLDALGIGRVILVGHSSGGGKITRFAQLHASRVSRLVYLDTVYRYLAPGLEEQLDAAIVKRIGGRATESLELMRRSEQVWDIGAWSEARERNLREVLAVQADGSLKHVASAAWFKAFSSDMPAGRYFGTRIPHPALMIFAKNLDYERAAQFDSVTQAALKPLIDETEKKRREQIRDFRANGRQVRIIEMPRTGHYCFVHKPQEVIRAIREFLVRSNPPVAADR